MSYLRKAKTSCGRYAEKPGDKDDNVNYEDETKIPLQDQIDNLRAKISLKEKYNKALQEEVLESNAGASSMITALLEQNKQLHEDLQNEKTAEKFAVRKALRSYRLFQMAVNEKNAESVINWLDDKIFDASKTLNEGVYLLKKMQIKLSDAEDQVHYLEKCPVPGSEPWEMRVEANRVYLECEIEARKANKDAALILNKKYKEILYVMKTERAKWPHIMQSMERTLTQLQNELSSLEVMLEDANRFRDDAREKLEITEQEASYNRKQRRNQMNKMKKSVEKALEANNMRYVQQSKFEHPSEKGSHNHKSHLPGMTSSMLPVSQQSMATKLAGDIKAKLQQVADYEEMVDRLVQAMRVQDVRQCPKRLVTVRTVNATLAEELDMKAEVQDLLVRHRNRLQLIQLYYRYSGSEAQEEFDAMLAEKKEQLQELEDEDELRQKEKNDDGNILTELRYSMIGLDEILHNASHHGKKLPHPTKNPDLKGVMKKALEKIRALVDSVEDLNKLFSTKKQAHRSYANYVKYNLAPRHVRAGAPEEEEAGADSDEDIDAPDSKIPSREELKGRSERFYAQALLRRGISK